jgi:hypothetical protein
MKIVIDEQGNVIDELKKRNEEIIKSLEEVLKEFRDKDALNTKSRKNYGFQMLQFIEDELNERCPLLSPEKFVELDVDDLDYYWKRFHNLITYYNRYFEIVPNRQMFMSYLGCNSRMYAQLKKGGENKDELIADTMLFIDDKLMGKGYSAGESGNADPKAISKRLSASGMAGHEVISASEDKLIEKVDQCSPADLKRQLTSVIGDSAKLIGGK